MRHRISASGIRTLQTYSVGADKLNAGGLKTIIRCRQPRRPYSGLGLIFVMKRGAPKLDAAALPDDAVGERDRRPIVGGFECFEARNAVVGPDEIGGIVCSK